MIYDVSRKFLPTPLGKVFASWFSLTITELNKRILVAFSAFLDHFIAFLFGLITFDRF